MIERDLNNASTIHMIERRELKYTMTAVFWRSGTLQLSGYGSWVLPDEIVPETAAEYGVGEWAYWGAA